MALKEFQVIGRRVPTEKEPTPTVYKMQLFASDAVRARSRFWYFMSKLRKVKKSKGEVIAVHQVYEKNPSTVKNFGVWIRYDSRSGTHNMYKEYRDTHLVGAVEQMYSELAARHRARPSSIQIVRTAVVAAPDCKRAGTRALLTDNIKFPLPNDCLPRIPNKHYRTPFKASRPNTSAF